MMSNRSSFPCRLCSSEQVHLYSRDAHREYFRCEVCGLVFVPPPQHLSPDDEKRRYDLHRNSPQDPGYRAFLNRLFIPLQQRLAPRSNGLDFGSGPVPVLARLFTEAGHVITLYDQYYAPDNTVFEKQYDFITACEVAEHLREPGRELDRLWSCLKPGGTLGVMTKFIVDREAFPQWHYKNDRTHICFYSEQTFSWLAGQWGGKLTIPEKDVVLMTKNRDDRNREDARVARKS